jgi:hypothetical protein
VAKVHAADGCDADAALTVTVSSNHPPAEHGRHDPDWRVVERDGVFWVWARAERDGRKKGDRVYTITATATDGSGNVATANETVTVSHDRRDGHRGHDDDDDHGDDGRRHD